MIRYWDYLYAYQRDREEILSIVDRVFSSGRLILGAHVAAFEASMAALAGCSFGIGVNSATDALFLSLKAVGVLPGDEVITVSNTAIPTVSAIRAAGAMPVFVDVREDTYLMDASLLGAAITPRTRCIIPVHLCGQMAEMEEILKIAGERGIPVIEDCAQAAGAKRNGTPAGGFGSIGAFSFYPTKVLGGFGDGGMITTSDPLLAEKLKMLRFYGISEGYHAEEEGYNSRLDEVHAAILTQRLTRLEAEVERRREVARIYDRALAGMEGMVGLPQVSAGNAHQYYLYTVRCRDRNRLMEYLAEHSIETRINYPVPIHLMRGYRFLGIPAGTLPVTERLADEILSLPMHGGLGDEEAETVATAVRRFYGC